MSLLEVDRLCAGYGDVQVLWDVTLALEEHHTTCLVGANGAGKTTLLRAIVGQLSPKSGQVRYHGRGVGRLKPYQKAGMGLVLVPEGRQLFTTLSVRENLDLGATPAHSRAAYKHNLEWVLELFPRLRERLGQEAGTLSGGEQQMLAIGRGLMGSPDVLLLDEPSLGLAPVAVISLYQIVRQLKQTGLTILLVEQNLHLALAMSEAAYVLSEGRIVLSGPSSTIRDMPEVQAAYLGGPQPSAAAAANLEPVAAA